MTLAPWGACFTAYCFLYYYFPRDRARARGEGGSGEGPEEVSTLPGGVILAEAPGAEGVAKA